MIHQHFAQKQLLKISPQQIQMLNIFFLNTLELETRISNELEENPFLENKETDTGEDETSLKTASDVQDYQDWDEFSNDDSFSGDKLVQQSYISREDIPQKILLSTPDFKEDAKQQLRLLELDANVEDIANYIIDMLNDNGLLDLPPAEIAEQISFSKQRWVETEEINYSLSIVQTLEPTGIGSTCIRDCLLRQLQAIRKKNRDTEQALEFVQHHYNAFINNRHNKIHDSFSEDQLISILKIISKLNFYPVCKGNYTGEPKQTIIPDFIISIHGDSIQVNIHSSRSDSIFINQSLYEQFAGAIHSRDKLSKQYIKSKFKSALWFVSAIKQRENTMLQVMNCIAEIQKDYFIDGDSMQLKPMTLRIIAERTGLTLSTISRVTSRKYAQVHFGIIHLKTLFSEGISDSDGKVISSKVVQSAISDTIANEDRHKPYSDLQVVNILSGQGYKLARRTVTKYRQHMEIPIAQVRGILAK